MVRSLNGGGLENSLYTEGRLMRKSILLTVVLVFSLALVHAGVGLAAEWQQDNTGWKYQNDDGSYSTSKWQEIGGKYYYFDENSYILKDTTTPDGYQVGSDGAWIQNVTSGRTINYDVFSVYLADINSTYGELKAKYGESSAIYPSGVYYDNSPLNGQYHYYEENNEMYDVYLSLGLTTCHSYYYFKLDYENSPRIKDADKPVYINVDSEQLFSDFPWIEYSGRPDIVNGESMARNNPRTGRTVNEIWELLNSYGITNLKVLDKKISYNWRKYDGTSGTAYAHPTYIRFSIDGHWVYLSGGNGTLSFPRMIKIYPEINPELEKKFNESEYSKDAYWGKITVH